MSDEVIHRNGDLYSYDGYADFDDDFDIDLHYWYASQEIKTNSLEFKQMQYERIYKTKPWLKSTGSKTAEGKERPKMNALKISYQVYILIKEMDCLMRQQKEIFNTIN